MQFKSPYELTEFVDLSKGIKSILFTIDKNPELSSISSLRSEITFLTVPKSLDFINFTLSPILKSFFIRNIMDVT